MGYKDKYLAVKDAVERKLQEGVPALKLISFGEKLNVGQLQFPCLFIIPGEDDIEPATNTEWKHNINFELLIVHKNFDIQAGLLEVVDLAGQCYDILAADRQLGGIALDLLIGTVHPGYGRTEGNSLIHWAVIEITVQVFIG